MCRASEVLAKVSLMPRFVPTTHRTVKPESLLPLRRFFGLDDLGAEGFSADQVRSLIARDLESGALVWPLEPGDTVRRRALHEVYGGQQQSGIVTPRSVPELLVFTDPAAGERYGYDKFEGLHEDGSYSYTGEGQQGDQQFVRGNKAMRDSGRTGKRIRVFRTKGTEATYVGEFATSTRPYELEKIPDVAGQPREGIVFSLLPVDAQVALLPAYGGELEPSSSLVDDASTLRSWNPPEYSDVLVPSSAQDDRIVSRVEFELQSQFGAWLAHNGSKPFRLQLRAGSTKIEPDFYVPDRGWIVEAKRSTARGYVRTAIGQVLDYINVASRAGIEATPVVLLPGRPEPDLIELMGKLGIIVAIRSTRGFVIEGN